MTSTRPLSILQITDLHLFETPKHKMAGIDTEYTFYQVLDEAHHRHDEFDLILVTGDLAQDGSQSAYERIYQRLEAYPSRVVCLPGNHDNPILMQKIIAGERVNCDESIQFDDWQVINLNSKKQGSESGLLVTEELDLLKQLLEVEENTQLNTLIAVHHHPLPTKSEWLDTMIIQNREALFLLVEKYPQVKAITLGRNCIRFSHTVNRKSEDKQKQYPAQRPD